MKANMHLTQFTEREKLIEWAQKIKQIAEDCADKVSTARIEQEILDLQTGRFMLAVLGKVKRGKSTFCNAYLGRQNDKVAPVDKLPASSVISKFHWSEQEAVKVIFRDGRAESVDFQRIAD